MSFKGIRGVCRRPHFLPLEKKKKALGKDNDKVLWDNYWNILEYCAVTNTFSLSHTAYPHFYFSFLPNKSLLPSPSQSLALTFLLILLLSSFHSFVSLFLPSFLLIYFSLSISVSFPIIPFSKSHTFVSFFLHICICFLILHSQYFSSILSGGFWLCHGKIYVILP